MSASAIPAALPSSPGPSAAATNGAAADQAPRSGFDAVLASVGGQADPATVAAAPAPGAQSLNGQAAADMVLAEGEAAAADALTAKAADDITNALTTEATNAATAAAQAACAAALLLPVAPVPVALAAAPVSPTEGGEQAEPTAGDGKGLSQPAINALRAGELTAEATDAAAAATEAETQADADQAGLDMNTAGQRAAAKLDTAAALKLAAAAATRAAATPAAPMADPPDAPPPAPVAPAAPSAIAAAAAAPTTATTAEMAKTATPAPPPAVGPKEKAEGSRSARGQQAGARTTPTVATKTGTPATPAADAFGKALVEDYSLKAMGTDDSSKITADAPAASADAGGLTSSTTTSTTQTMAGALPVRGSPQTVANLAAEIAKKLDGRSTRFDVELNPQGLGRVDVRMEIGESGRMTAAMTFDTPQAAAELRARSAELQRHLEQAGFDMSGGLSFDVAGDRGHGRQAQQHQDAEQGPAFRGRAFQQALATAGDAAQSAVSGALNLRRSLLAGVDIRI